jgi:transposase-like protein
MKGRPLTKAECGEAGILARLATEDWDAMTAAALASRNHVSSLDRWIKKAREGNPSLSDEQAERLAERLRKDHYRRMGRLSVQARKLAREAEAELARADGRA